MDGQPTPVHEPGLDPVGIGYDPAGRHDATILSRGQITSAYHPGSQLASLASPDGVTLGWGYDGPLLTTAATSHGPAATTVDRVPPCASEPSA